MVFKLQFSSTVKLLVSICVMMLFMTQVVWSAKLVEVKVIDQDYLMVYFVDGDVTFPAPDYNGGGQVTTYGSPLNTSNAGNTGNWTIKSNDDGNYGSVGLQPTNAYRKTKINGMKQGAWSGGDYNYEYTYQHEIFLKLPQSMVQGNSYTLEINSNTNSDVTSQTFTFDIYNSRSEAIHVNVVGYSTASSIKPVDLYQYLGDGGTRDYSGFEGNKVYIYNVDTDQSTEVGSVSFWKSSSGEAQGYNLTGSDVWNADFTGFNQAGTYKIAIEGIGCSDEFEIKDDVYRNPYEVSLLGYYYMRIGEDGSGMTPPPRQPKYLPNQDPSGCKVYLTNMHPYHPDWGTFSSGDAWDNPDDWIPYQKSGNPTNPNAYGGHSDAFDWDRHLGHVSNIYDLLLPYFLSDGAISDDDIGIPESGNGIPDIIDEARNEVDFWLRLRDGKAYSHGLTNPNGSDALYQAGPTAIAAWTNALNSAMLSNCFKIAGNTSLMNTYRDSAIVAYNYANGLSDKMLDDHIIPGAAESKHLRGRDLKMMAAAFIYNVTGNTSYENDMANESVVTGSTSEIAKWNSHNQLWGTAAYLLTDQAVNYSTLQDNMRQSIINQAMSKEVNYSNSRPSRRSTDNNSGYFWTNQDVHRTLVAHAVTTSQSEKDTFEDALVLEADFELGRNPLNIIYMTTAHTSLESERSVENIYTTGKDDGAYGVHPGHTPYLNHDNWYCGMTMGCPGELTDKCYPAFSGWPKAEGYFNTRWVWAHSEFTPRQTMRGKMALYGYLYGLGSSGGGGGPGTTYTLTVNSGSGDGDYEAGTNVGISADAAPSGQQFDAWTGDVANVADVNSANTSITMPSADATVTANYEDIPSGGSGIPGKIEAEDYTAMSGIQTQTTSDTGGGENVGWVDTGDWLDYEVDVANAGDYEVTFRIASQSNGTKFNFKEGSNVLTSVDEPATGGWQNWTSVTKTVTLSEGVQTLRIEATGSGWNINWMDYAETSAPVTYTLTVNNGTGDGDYEAGTNVSISADAAPSGQQFDAWTGDVANVADVNSANTTIAMPSSGTTITANYKNVTTETCGEISNNGFEANLTSWTDNGGNSIVSDANSGGNALKTGPGEGGVHYGQLIDVGSNTDYNFTVYAKVANAPSWAGIGLDFLDASGTELSETSISSFSSSYSQESMNGSLPANTASIRLWTWKSGSTGSLFMDDVCLTLSGGGTTTSDITLHARGNCGSETMTLEVDGNDVQTWNNLSTTAADYTYSGYSGGVIKVKFTNDGNSGCDRNLFVDYIEVGSTTYQTENDATRTGCGDSQWLWCNGNFDFGDVTAARNAGSIASALRSGNEQQAVSVYPVPSSGTINIDLDIAEKADIHVVNNLGQIVHTSIVEGKSQNKLRLSPGVYFVKITGKTKTFTNKVIVE